MLATLMTDEALRRKVIKIWKDNLWQHAVNTVKRYQKRKQLRADLAPQVIARALLAPEADWTTTRKSTRPSNSSFAERPSRRNLPGAGMCVAYKLFYLDAQNRGGTMARLVSRTAQQPTKYVIDGKDQWLCKCGLSRNQPYCDGSHKATLGEAPGKLYWYDEAGKRHEVTEQYPGIRTY